MDYISYFMESHLRQHITGELAFFMTYIQYHRLHRRLSLFIALIYINTIPCEFIPEKVNSCVLGLYLLNNLRLIIINFI